MVSSVCAYSSYYSSDGLNLVGGGVFQGLFFESRGCTSIFLQYFPVVTRGPVLFSGAYLHLWVFQWYLMNENSFKRLAASCLKTEAEPASETWCFSVYTYVTRWTKSKRRRLYLYVIQHRQNPDAILSRFGPCGLFLVPKVKILTKIRIFRTVEDIEEISIRDLRAIPQKHVPGRVPELEKTLGAVYQEWRGVLWRSQVWLSCK